MKTCFDLVYGADPKVHVLGLYLPETEQFPVFIYFHGDGLEAGDKPEAEFFAQQLTEKNIAVASVRYRMYPDAKFPDFIEDCAQSVKWIIDNIGTYGKCSGIFVGGSSAGGYLSMMLCFDSHYLKDAGVQPDQVTGYIHNAGQPTSHFNVLREQGIDTRRIIVDQTAPLYFVGMEDHYSPMLFLAADHDMENRLEQTELMMSTLRHFRYDESTFHFVKLHADHCSYIRPAEDGVSLFGKICARFIKENL